MNRNFINLNSSEFDKPIFRVISLKRLYELFHNKENVLVSAKLWDDPFENYIMNSTGQLESGELFDIEFRNNFFRQCWTRTRESDAMWRIYSLDKRGVRIASTPRKLLQYLYNSAVEFLDLSSFIGKVKYYTTPKLEQLLETNASSWILDPTGAGEAQTLLFKRTPFKHENEVRLIFNSYGKHSGKLYKYKIDPFEMIDDIVFDPRMEYKDLAQEKRAIKDLGFKKRIVKSILYHSPKLSFKFKR